MIGEIVTGSTPKTTVSAYYGNEYPFYKPTDLDAGLNVKCSHDMLSAKGYSVSRHLKANSVLVTCIGATIGKTGIIRKEGTCNQQINAIIPNECLNADYIYYCCIADFFQKSIINNAASTTLPILNKNKFMCLYFPLPPLAEQHRIVERIEKLLPHIEAYDTAEQKLTVLNKAFPEQLKKSILQAAVQGKLVPQDPSDEPASVLLERIRAEREQLIKDGKLKRSKNEGVIYRRDNSHYEKVGGVERCIDDELPFEIPESWAWCRLGEVVNVVSARRVHQSDWKKSGVPFYRAREIAKLAEYGYVDNELYISQELFDNFSKSGVPQENDLMVTAVGTIGKTYIVKKGDVFYYKDASVVCFENFAKINAQYMKSLIDAPYMVEQIKGNSAGTTVDTITIVKANQYLIALPPLAEQHRIVECVDTIMQLTEQL